jgi:hypothetical protein
MTDQHEEWSEDTTTALLAWAGFPGPGIVAAERSSGSEVVPLRPPLTTPPHSPTGTEGCALCEIRSA